MSSLCSFRLERSVDDRQVDVLVVFLSIDELRSEELSSLVDREIEKDLAPDEMILITRRTSFDAVKEAIGTSPECEVVRNRLGRAAVTVIGFGAKANEVNREVVKHGPVVSGFPLSQIGRRAVTILFQKYGGFVEANSNYHFLNPSGRHTDRFIRLSNLLISSAEISLVAMTILPLLSSDAEVAHVDTPAMFSIVSAINDHLKSLAPTRTWLRCENFRSYVNVHKHDFTSAGNPVILISASSSGSMANLIADRGVPADQIGHVLYLGEDPASVRCAIDLTYDKDINPDGINDKRATYSESQCRLCEAGSVPVPLKGDQFDMGGPDFEPLTMTKDDAPLGLGSTLKRLARYSALQISTEKGSKARQYYVDVDQLFGQKAFVERLQYLARRHVPSTVRECIVLDKGSTAFAELIMKEAEAKPKYLDRASLDDLKDADETGDQKKLNGLPIVIASGVIESGRSLRDISRDLRRSRPKSPQIYLVGVFKLPSSAKGGELEKTLVQTHEASKHAFACAERLILPPSGTANAWHAELDFLNKLDANGIAISDTLKARRDALNRSSEPLINELFVSIGLEPLRIQPGFVFWPQNLSASVDPSPSQGDVFYTISSVLQGLRTKAPEPGGRSLRTNWFQQTRLDPANLGRFNDGVIQASILRAARPVEIDYSNEDDFAREAGRVVCRILEAADKPRGEVACEILIAIGSNRLRLPRSELETILKHRISYPPIVAELANSIRSLIM